MSYPELKGKAFVVTGASSGMGRSLALLLANQGAHVGLLDMRKPDHVLEEVEKLGGKGLSLECNVQSSTGTDQAVKAVKDHFGHLDGAANMAGTVGKLGSKGAPIVEMSDEDWDSMVATNLTGVKNSLKAELKYINSNGSIVNAASIAGQQGNANHSTYSATKFGVIGLTKSAAQESGKSKGVRINAVAPGFVNTPLTQSLGDPKTLDQAFVGPRTALGRMAEPEEIAKVILFLLSDQAGYMTSSVVNVDGGWQ